MSRRPYLEEQVAGLKQICEALICHIHYTTEKHDASSVDTCEHEVCKRYMDGWRLYMFAVHPK
jgi:hypothetical protein